jgi:hypothetical protein
LCFLLCPTMPAHSDSGVPGGGDSRTALLRPACSRFRNRFGGCRPVGGRAGGVLPPGADGARGGPATLDDPRGAWLPDQVRLGDLERHLGDGVIEAVMDAELGKQRLKPRQRRRLMSYPLVSRLMIAMTVMPDVISSLK